MPFSLGDSALHVALGSRRLTIFMIPRFARPDRDSLLIDSFRQLTGVPMLLNTSFNENEPIVCQPEETIDCFLPDENGCPRNGKLLRPTHAIAIGRRYISSI